MDKSTTVSCPKKPWEANVSSSKDIWVWVNTYRYIFSGMNIHKSQLFWGSLGTRVLTHPHIRVEIPRKRWGLKIQPFPGRPRHQVQTGLSIGFGLLSETNARGPIILLGRCRNWVMFKSGKILWSTVGSKSFHEWVYNTM